MSELETLPMCDIPPEVAKELERLHALVLAQPDTFPWVKEQLERIYQVYFNPIIQCEPSPLNRFGV